MYILQYTKGKKLWASGWCNGFAHHRSRVLVRYFLPS